RAGRGTPGSASAWRRSSVEFVFLYRRAGADQVPVARRALDQPDRGPELVDLRPRRRVRRALAGVRAVPAVGQHHLRRVRRVLDRVVRLVELPLLDLADLLADRDQRVAEAV